MNPTQQIEAAARDTLAKLNAHRSQIEGGYDTGDESAVKILLRFAAQLMQTGAMKEVEESLQRMAYDYQDDTRERQMGCARYMRQEARGALASISALKGLGEDKP